jgi:tetratricopeptide (TPR) repeat protein
MLADASRRAGRTRLEGECFYRMAVLHDNTGNYAESVSCYKKYLLACRRTGDVEGEALALNHLGAAYQLMGPDQYHRAIACHARHRDITDARGRYTAHCNLGLLFMDSGQYDRAAQNFRHALRYAIHLSNIKGEQFAYEHLSAAGTLQGDTRFARSCMERCLALATTMNDLEGRQAAFSHLGRMATARGDYDEASRCFSASLEVRNSGAVAAAAAAGSRHLSWDERPSSAAGEAVVAASGLVAEGPAAKQVRCELGVALGNAAFDDFMSKLSDSVGPLSVRV